MSTSLTALGIDEESFTWRDLILCKGMDVNLFFDYYEASESVAKTIDEMCLSCPVLKQCLEDGIENKEHGVHGGVYLSNGKPDTLKNRHKTQDIWKQLKDRISGQDIL